MRPNTRPLVIDLPALPDEVAVDILDFLHDFINLFESRYATQIRRYYRDHDADNIIQSLRSPQLEDPPF